MAEKLELPDRRSDGPPLINLVIGCTGSIAAIKIPELVRKLHATNKFNIILLPSTDSLHFFELSSSHTTTKKVDRIDSELPGFAVFKDEDEYRFWQHRDDPVLHIEIRKWADLLLVAPLSADTLAKIACGRCDTLLLEVLRAWDYSTVPIETTTAEARRLHTRSAHSYKRSNRIYSKKLVACPAMNTHMYIHPLTARHLQFLQDELHFELLGPIEKRLACGDLGTGGMSEVGSIVDHMTLLASEMQVIKSADCQTPSMRDKALADLDEDVEDPSAIKQETGKRLGWGESERSWTQQQQALDEEAKQEKQAEPMSDYEKRIRDQLDE